MSMKRWSLVPLGLLGVLGCLAAVRMLPPLVLAASATSAETLPLSELSWPWSVPSRDLASCAWEEFDGSPLIVVRC